MRDPVAEIRYQALRTKLNDLHYYQPLSLESSIIAERLLADLIESIERSQELKRRGEERAQQLRACAAELAALHFENPRLQAENNALHLEIIEAGETAERLEAEARLRLRTLEDEFEGVRLALQQTECAESRWEKELHALRERAFVLLRRPAPLVSAPSGGAARAALHGHNRQRGPLVAASVADGLRNKAECLNQAFRDCEAQVAELAAKVLATTRRSVGFEEEAAAAGQRLVTEGPDLTALGQKAEAARLQDTIAELQESITRRTTDCVELEQQCNRLGSECRERNDAAAVLRLRVGEMKGEEVRAAQRAGQMWSAREERSRMEEAQVRKAKTARDELRAFCQNLAARRQRLAAELKEASETGEKEKVAYAKEAEALQADLEVQARRCSHERASLVQQMASLESRVREAAAVEADAEARQEALEAEVATTQAMSEECARQLAGRTEEIEKVLLGGAVLQQQSQRSTAELRLLNSSLQGLRAERELLVKHLKAAQAAHHKDSLDCVDLALSSQRLQAMVKSLDSTQGEWTLDLDRTTAALRRAHEMLSNAMRRLEAARGVEEQVSRNEHAVEASVDAAAEQRAELAAEVLEWGAELAEEKARCEAACSMASKARERLTAMEDESRAGARGWELEEESLLTSLRRLHKEIAAVSAEDLTARRKRDEEHAELSWRINHTEESMGRMESELEDMLLRHDHAVAEAERVRARHSRDEVATKAVIEEVMARQAQLQSVAEERAKAENELRETQAAEGLLQDKMAKFNADLRGCEDEASEVVRRRSLVQKSLQCLRAEHEVAKASEHSRSEELSAARARVEAVSARCDGIHADAEDLVALVSSAESTRELLGTELGAEEREIEEERVERQRLASSNSCWGEEHRMAAAEVEALQKAAMELDAERDECQKVADYRTEELGDLQREAEAQQRALLETHQVVDDLRATIAAGADRLAEHRQASAAQGLKADEFATLLARLREEVRENSSEATDVHDDLMHMTKENQALHEEMRVLERRLAGLASGARGQLAEQELLVQQLKAVEMEHDDIVRLYQQVAQQTRQHSMVVERLRAESEAARSKVAEVEAELHTGRRAEEECQAHASQSRFDISVLEGQLTDLMGRLARADLTRQEGLTEDARLEGDVAAAEVVCRGASQRETMRAHASAALGLRRQQLQTAVKRARSEVTSNQRFAVEGRAQMLRLEGLLEEERRRCRDCAAENEALRRCLDDARGGGVIAAETSLKIEVDRRYAQVGELDAEQQSLSAEAAKLRALLRDRREAMAAAARTAA